MLIAPTAAANIERGEPVLDLAFHPSGDRLVGVTAAQAVVVWDTHTWEPLQVLSADQGFFGIAFSDDGSTALTMNNIVGLELRDGLTLEVLDGPVEPAMASWWGQSVGFDDGDRRAATTGPSGAQLWLLDPHDFAAAPRARVELPQRIPAGFHAERAPAS